MRPGLSPASGNTASVFFFALNISCPFSPSIGACTHWKKTQTTNSIVKINKDITLPLFTCGLILLLTPGLPLPTMAAETVTRLLVKWKDGPGSAAAAAGNRTIGSTVKKNFYAIGWQMVEVPPGLGVQTAMESYRQLGTVLAVEPDGRINPSVPSPPPPAADAAASKAASLEAAILTASAGSGVIPNDPLFAQQWNLRIIGATNAWLVTTGSAEVVVAVFDTGIDYTHPDLAPNMWRNPGETGLDANGQDKAANGLDDDANGYVDDVHGVDVARGTGDPMDVGFWGLANTNPIYHGTVVAGFIGAVGNNGIGVAGVNWSVRMMSIRPWGGDPRINTPTIWASHTLAAWDYVITMKRRGVNIRVASKSIGGATKSAAIVDAIITGGDEGILTVFAASNEALDQDVYSYFPGAFRVWCAINVASSTELDGLAPSSCFGRSTVDIAAPGANVTSTTKGGTYQSGGGTSLACPTVSGAAALLLAINPSLTVNEIRAALFGSVDQPAALRDKLITHGRLNVARAIEYLTNANPSAIVIHMAPAGQQALPSSPIQVRFNRPMNRASVEAAFSVSPPVSGAFIWADDSRSFSFSHELPFNIRTNYTVRLAGTAQDEVGGALDGNFNRNREGAPNDDFFWLFRFPIPNDDFADAQVVVGPSGSLQASNRYTFIEAGEPAHVLGDQLQFGSSVWYRWTAPEPGGWFTFDLTSGTSFDSLLAVYSGESLGQLMAVAGNDNYGSRPSSRLSFPATPGTHYSVVVASKSEMDPNQAGNFVLAWYPTPAPIVSSLNRSSAYPGQSLTFNGTNFTGATGVLFNGATATFTFSTNPNFSDLQLTATVPTDATTGPVTIETAHGNATSTNVFTILPLPALSIQPVPGTNLVQLSWPSLSGFSLQHGDTFSPTGNWTSFSITSQLANGMRVGTTTVVSSNRFFRLRNVNP